MTKHTFNVDDPVRVKEESYDKGDHDLVAAYHDGKVIIVTPDGDYYSYEEDALELYREMTPEVIADDALAAFTKTRRLAPASEEEFKRLVLSAIEADRENRDD